MRKVKTLNLKHIVVNRSAWWLAISSRRVLFDKTQQISRFIEKSWTASKKVPLWLRGCLGLKRPTSVGLIWVCGFSIVPSAAHCMLTNSRTKQLALVFYTGNQSFWWNEKFSIDKAHKSFKMYSKKIRNFTSIYIVLINVRDLFLDFQECRGAKNGGGGGGGWLVRLGTSTSSTFSEKPKVLASQIRVWVRQHCGFTKTFHSELLLQVQTYWCRALSTYDVTQEMSLWDLFLRKASLCERYSKKVPHWLHGCLGLNRPTSFGPIWECRFSIVPSATHCMLTNTRTKQLALVVDTGNRSIEIDKFGNL